MSLISLIAAVDEQLGIGKDNQLLCHQSADLQYFKKVTMGKPIIMGRKTFESIGKPLPGRTNIVLSRDNKHPIDGVIVVSSLDAALDKLNGVPEVMIIGGGELFNQAIPVAKRIYLTIIHHHFNADTFFPEVDESIWRCTETTMYEHDDKNPYDMTFKVYER